MKVDSARFGSLEVEDDKVIEFPNGLPGFEHCKRFSLFHEENGHRPIVYTLQSLDDPAVALPITDPANFGFRYELTLEDPDVDLLDLQSTEEATVAVVLHRTDANPRSRSADARVSANLLAPLVINTRTRRGLQQLIPKVGVDVTIHPVQ
jgi:flagellar assembly factor FliW